MFKIKLSWFEKLPQKASKNGVYINVYENFIEEQQKKSSISL